MGQRSSRTSILHADGILGRYRTGTSLTDAHRGLHPRELGLIHICGLCGRGRLGRLELRRTASAAEVNATGRKWAIGDHRGQAAGQPLGASVPLREDEAVGIEVAKFVMPVRVVSNFRRVRRRVRLA